MPKWDKFLELEEEVVEPFEKFDKTVKIGRRAIKRGEEVDKQKKQREKDRNEKRTAKRGDEV